MIASDEDYYSNVMKKNNYYGIDCDFRGMNCKLHILCKLNKSKSERKKLKMDGLVFILSTGFPYSTTPHRSGECHRPAV